MSARLERKIAELVVGTDGGWSLWLGALAAITAAVEDSRLDGETRFSRHPQGEVSRLRSAIVEAVCRAEFAAELRAIVLDEGQSSSTSIAELLKERAIELVLVANPHAVGEDIGVTA